MCDEGVFISEGYKGWSPEIGLQQFGGGRQDVRTESAGERAPAQARYMDGEGRGEREGGKIHLLDKRGW